MLHSLHGLPGLLSHLWQQAACTIIGAGPICHSGWPLPLLLTACCRTCPARFPSTPGCQRLLARMHCGTCSLRMQATTHMWATARCAPVLASQSGLMDNSNGSKQQQPSAARWILCVSHLLPQEPPYSGYYASASCCLTNCCTTAVIICLFCCVLQGMNFLAGLLLLAVDHDCSKTFWLLVVLLEQVFCSCIMYMVAVSGGSMWHLPSPCVKLLLECVKQVLALVHVQSWPGGCAVRGS